MNILVLNPGSSSLKRAFFRFPEAIRLPEEGSADAVGVRVVHGGSRFVEPVVVDASARDWETVYVSAGRRGLQVSLAPDDLVRVANATVAPIAAA